MTPPRIGVNVDDLRLEPKRAFRKAAEMRFRVAEVATVSGELAPRALSHSARRHLARFADGLGLRIAALTADLPHSWMPGNCDSFSKKNRSYALMSSATMRSRKSTLPSNT